MKIGVFGGSFNPIHKGHINIIKVAIEELELDKLFIVPTFKSPFKLKNKYINDENRVEMIKKVLPPKSEISLFEINRKCTSFTIDTVRYFKQKFPNDEIFLIIGSDNVNKLNKWKDIKEISKLSKITIFKRNNEYSKVNIKKFNCKILNNYIWPESSSDIRKGQFKHLEKSVHEYISEKQLFLKDINKNILSIKRHKHSQSTGYMAAELAKKHEYDPKRAWTAGFMHDITKEWEEEKQRLFLLKYGFEAKDAPSNILHQWTGALWLQEVYKLKDKEIIQAVFRHTTADSFEKNKLTKLDKIVYIADKLCEGRKYKGINKHRELAYKDLDKCFDLVSEERQKHYVNEVNKKYKLTKVKE
ncbi:MAG: nicotinate-nucleotide adenylyltransferase [Mycoplasma sp.]|nr:nicotinate-nucleotide adenylyltransferase [Mycoplasma sp.]